MGHSHKAWNKPDYYFRTQVGPQLSELGSQTQLPNPLRIVRNEQTRVIASMSSRDWFYVLHVLGTRPYGSLYRTGSFKT